MSNSCECPYCGKKLTLRQCLSYLNKGKEHSVLCNNCGRSIHPQKNPYSPQKGAYWGVLSAWLPGVISIYIFHTDLITAWLVALPFIIITCFLSAYIWYRNLYFE